jgi:2,3-bisphosphoglycerate-dependent phosphoglycerate mutase
VTDTFVLRHASTAHSRNYLVNGDPSVHIGLDRAGREHCREVRDTADWLPTVRGCVVSEFGRTAQTARLLLGDAVEPHVEPRLNEVGYGTFESGPWLAYGEWLAENGRFVRPPGAAESLHEVQLRLLDGLRACLDRPAPRLVVSHGALIALLRRVLRYGDAGPVTLPGEDHLAVIALSDRDLAAVVADGTAALRALGGALVSRAASPL